MADRFGPLEIIGGQWVIGDSAARHAKYLQLGRQGMSCWADGVEAQLIPWPRFVELSLSATATRLGNSKLLAKVTDLALGLGGVARHGGGSACVVASLRHPYEEWSAEFSHHADRYDRHQIVLANEFLSRAVQCGKAPLLGDTDWVSGAIEKMSHLAPASSRSLASAVQEMLDGL
ncbi:hypothetical protein ABZ402_50895 [Streptomyces mirabilis]|uniref:hypothetical protein n=1 Tax=Streptomyces mirabilis TaxID=68239 RepID=UPI0033DA0695